MSFKSIVIIALLIVLFFVFKPQIMGWVHTITGEYAPTTNKANTTYQEFKQHDLYQREKKIENTMDKLAE
ncbi:MAG: hypothetical protein PHU91_05190 [Candidatus Omnitrophica bacterium]|nr:hypothetical protein [Candidatus Omnitrophota bacterium]MDD5237039.1 hypothetical protein [Candidatus Omnitrophota bacterium]MDD5611233.1 hypothetical protein [Candidatus Omnitrophota bacterium]